METQVAYEQQIVQTVRTLPFHRKLEALRMLQRLERVEEAKKEAEEEVKPKLPRFMQNMIEAGTLELSNLADYVKPEYVRPKANLEELRRRLREKGVSVPIEEYIRAERNKR